MPDQTIESAREAEDTQPDANHSSKKWWKSTMKTTVEDQKSPLTDNGSDIDPATPSSKVRKEVRTRAKKRIDENGRIWMEDPNYMDTVPHQHSETLREYSFSLIAVSLFYGLPVWQLVMSHQALLQSSGNEDLCYYNIACSNRLGAVSDFNHVISNAGYIILGVLFMVMVRRRSAFTAKLREQVPHVDD